MVLWKAGYAHSKKGQNIAFDDPQTPNLSGSAPSVKVTASSIPVFEGRGAGSPALGHYPAGSRITVLGDALDEEYAKVIWKTGYAYSRSGQYIRFVIEPGEPNAIVTANRISVRAGRGLRFTKLGEFKKGDEIVVLDDTLDYDCSRVIWNGRLRLLRVRKAYQIYGRAANRRMLPRHRAKRSRNGQCNKRP